MQKTEIIKRVVGESIRPHGFIYLGDDPESCTFRKQIGELQQDITIYYAAENELKIYFGTNAYGQKPIYGEDLVRADENRGDVLGRYHYSNELEFITVIEYFKKIIFDYGFTALEKISVHTTQARPTKEANLYLYENHEKLNREYRKKFKIDENASNEDIFLTIQEYLVKTQGQPFDEVKETMIGLAAIIGTVFKDVSDGIWKWDSVKNICWVANRDKYPKMQYPLNTIIGLWNKNAERTFTFINDNYKWFCIK